MSDCGFYLDGVAEVIRVNGFKMVVLQFPDGALAKCTDVYDALSNIIDDDVDMFITADSTFGSSLDDVSAQHVEADILFYFGDDLSSSGSLPVAIVPFRKQLDVGMCAISVCGGLEQNDKEVGDWLLLSELGYHHQLDALANELDEKLPGTIHVPTLPNFADLSRWTLSTESTVSSELNDKITVGGLLVFSSLMRKDTASLGVIYVGNKKEQLVNVMLQLGSRRIYHVNPMLAENDNTMKTICVNSEQSRLVGERYGGVMRVEHAKIIGIIVGSMGLTGTLTRELVDRLTRLIAASGKKSYVFVMGRLTVEKICNFPEVDTFCLVSNDDNCLIKPKTFPVPVLTPYELELGLGARDWTCQYESSSVKSNTAEEEEAEVKVMIRKVNQLRRERAIENGEDVSDSEDEEEHTIVSSLVINNAEQGSSCAGSSSTALTLMQENDPSNSAIMLHSSPAVDYFQSREYRGLKPDLGADELNGEVAGSTRKVEIRAGLYGTASGYKPMVTALSILDQEEESAANSSSTSD